jgi:NitT/TauT family transport system substrate-binding protein
MNKVAKIVLVAVVIVVAGFLVWFGFRGVASPSSTVTAQAPLRIGLNPWIGNGLYYVAEQKGFFDAQKVNVQIVPYDDSAVGKQLLATGKIDVLPLTPETAITLADAGVAVKVIGMSDSSQGADGIIAAKGINSIADLKGKTVAFEVGSPSHLFLAMLLDKQGLSTNDVTVINETAPDAATSFLSGKVDAAVTWMPWLSEAGQRSGGHLLVSSKVLPILPDMFIVRADVLQSRPQDVSAMLRALFASRDWIMASSTNENEAYHITAQSLGTSDQDIVDQSSTFRWLSYQDNVDYMNDGQVHDLLQTAADLWLKLGLVKTKIDADDLIDASFLKNLHQ